MKNIIAMIHKMTDLLRQKWCSNDNERRKQKQVEWCKKNVGFGQIPRHLRARTFMTGTNKRILFIPDVSNISKINDNFAKFQSFLKNDIYYKYCCNNKTSNRNNTISYIFSRLSSNASPLTMKKNVNIHIKDITSLYHDNENNYLNTFRQQIHDNNNITSNTEIGLESTILNPLLQLQEDIEDIILHSKSPRNCSSGVKNLNLDFNKNLILPNDVQIDYNTWRSKIAPNPYFKVRSGSFDMRNIYCNHYYYHTLTIKKNSQQNSAQKLDYDIEHDRKLVEYPKLYNIDYDCVEKGFKYHVADFIQELRYFKTTHTGRFATSQWRYDRDLRTLRHNYGLITLDPNKDIYFNLQEFHKDCNIVGKWVPKGNAYGIDRSMDNFADYDFYNIDDSGKKDLYGNANDSNMTTMLIGNIDRMYNIKLNRMVEKWYKNGKYLFYAILPHENIGELSLSIDFCHFEIYYNRLKLLQSVVRDNDSAHDKYNNYNYSILSKYVWIALNDCSRYCKDELHRQKLFCAKAKRIFPCEMLKRLFENDDKATWDRCNKQRYKYQPSA